jgi:hypothetical protein
MSVLRNQDLLQVSVTLAAGVAQEVTLPRPRTLPAMGNTVDYVTSPSSRRDWEAGRAIIDLTAFAPATLVQKLELVRDPDSPFSDGPEPAGSAAEPLFPSGAPSPDLSRTAFEDAVGLASNDAGLVAFMQNLYVGGNEAIRLTLINAAGEGPLNASVAYDLGVNRSEIGLRSIN